MTEVSAIRTNTRCKEDPIYVFLEMKQRSPVPNFHIHVSFLGIFVSNFRYSVFAVCLDEIKNMAYERPDLSVQVLIHLRAVCILTVISSP